MPLHLNIPTGRKKKWSVRVVKYPIRSGGVECYGDARWEPKEIRISHKAVKEGDARSVLIHEVLHLLLPFMSEESILYLEEHIESAIDSAEVEGII